MAARDAGAALVVALVTWWAGADVGHALAWGAVAVVVWHLWRAAPGWDVSQWRAPMRAAPLGTRDDVTRLALRFGDRSGVEPAGLRRLRDVARARLAGHGLSLDDPADADRVAALLGPAAVAALRADRGTRVPLRQVDAVVAALDRLDPRPAPDAPGDEPRDRPRPTDPRTTARGEPRA